MYDILLKNALLPDDRRADILIDDGIIARILPPGSADPGQAGETIDCNHIAVIPGLVNMHTHAAMSLMRGIGEGAPDLHTWLEEIWRVEANINREYVYKATKSACLEMIKTGTTTFNDMYYHQDCASKAAVDMGIRPVVGYCFLDGFNEEKAKSEREGTIKAYETWKADGCPGLFEASFHSVYTVSEPMIIWTTEFARSHGLKLHIHLCETRKEVDDCKKAHGGLSPVEYLDKLGVLGPEVIAAHCLWLSERDIEILGERKVNCVHNINSNAKLGSGFMFRFKELTDAGANVCLGTDGCASSNNLDLMETLKTSGLFQNAWRQDPYSCTPKHLFDAATINAAKALGLDSGIVAEGAVADLCLVDTDNSYFLSPAPFLVNFVWSAKSECIDSVIARGRFVMRHRRVDGEKEVLEAARGQLSLINPK